MSSAICKQKNVAFTAGVFAMSFFSHTPVLAQSIHTSHKAHERKVNSATIRLIELTKEGTDDVGLAKRIIAQGARLDTHDIVADVKFYTPLQYAARRHLWQIVKLLVDKGANVNPAIPYGDEHFMTPLMHCSYSAPQSLIKLLIKKGAKVNAQGYHDLTALMVVAQQNRLDIAKILLIHGANTEIRSYFSKQTALDYAEEKNYSTMVKLMQSYSKKSRSRVPTHIRLLD